MNIATNNKSDALNAYTKDTQNGALCADYAIALLDLIEKGQAVLDAGCLSGFTKQSTQQAIEKDREERNSLGC